MRHVPYVEFIDGRFYWVMFPKGEAYTVAQYEKYSDGSGSCFTVIGTDEVFQFEDFEIIVPEGFSK